MASGIAITDTDVQLAAGGVSGNRDAFGKLYTRFAPLLMGMITRVVGDNKNAEDLLQQSFLAIWQNRHDAAGQPLLAWVLTMTRKTIFEYQEFNANSEVQKPVSFVNTSITTSGRNMQSNDTLQDAALELLFYRGRSLDEVSEMLNIEKEKLRIMLRTAVKRYKTPCND